MADVARAAGFRDGELKFDINAYTDIYSVIKRGNFIGIVNDYEVEVLGDAYRAVKATMFFRELQMSNLEYGEEYIDSLGEYCKEELKKRKESLKGHKETSQESE